MNWELIIALMTIALSIAIPLSAAIVNTGKRLTKFMAQMEIRVGALEKSEHSVCQRLDSMEQRQTQRHEHVIDLISQMREELVASKSINPRS
jgi:hypothetical protein